MKKGFSLPLWLAASAKSAVKKLLGLPFENYELLKIAESNENFKVKVHSVAFIKENYETLAVTFADSGLDLDLTRNLEIWTIASFKSIDKQPNNNSDLINIISGEGVGINHLTRQICISDFARSTLEVNLLKLIPDGYSLNLKIIFPKGKFLAERTSNKSFGIVEGLSIIGTSADVFTSASPDQLKKAKAELDSVISENANQIITFVIGENGLDLANKINITSPIIKIGNWIGPLLVHAAAKNLKEILLIGYHGKLIKLAGGIFHTHHHLADSRMEILTYHAFKAQIPNKIIEQISKARTVEEAYFILNEFNIQTANSLFNQIANTVEIRSCEYVNKYFDSQISIGAALFDRDRKIRWKGANGKSIFSKLGSFTE